MILERISRYIRHEKWFELFLELIVVVFGLFLAFQIDRWYELQRSESDMQEHLASLAEDFAENEARLTLAISEGRLEMESAMALRAEMRKDKPDLSVDDLNLLVSQLSLLPTFSAVDLSYRNLINDGTLAKFPNSGLKKELAEFYAAYELTKLIQNTQELQYVSIWQPYALANLDYAASNVKSDATRGFEILKPYINPDLILEAMQSKQFENIVVIQWETAEDLVFDWSHRLLKRVKRIQTMLPSTD